MHPILRKYSERNPRTYGLALLLVAIVLAGFWQKGAAWTFFLVMLSVGFGIAGASYIILGSRFCALETRCDAIWKGDNISGWAILALVGWGLGLLIVSLLVWAFLA